MIYAVCGSPGSYKSVHVLEKYIIPALKKGRAVYTNIENISAIHIATYFDLSPIDVDSNLHILGRVYLEDGTWKEDIDQVRKFYEHVPNNALIVIDEAQNYYSSRDFKEQYSKDVINYLTRHRHYGHDVIYITQAIESVDITFRRNTQITYMLKRAEHIGLKKLAIIYVFDRFDLERKPLARLTYSPNPSCFCCYSSYESSDVVENRKTYNVIFRNKGFWAFLIGIIVLLIFIFSGRFDRVVHGKFNDIHRENTGQPVSSAVATSSVSQVDPSSPSPEPPSQDGLCVKEWIYVHGKPSFVLSDGSVVANTGLSPCPK